MRPLSAYGFVPWARETNSGMQRAVAYPSAEFAAHLGVRSRETIRQYREKGRIFGWLKDSRSHRYPAWQIYH